MRCRITPKWLTNVFNILRQILLDPQLSSFSSPGHQQREEEGGNHTARAFKIR